jgi:biotin transport system ATP-binding protein
VTGGAGPEPTVELAGVTVRLDGRPVLREVSVRLTEHRVGVIGANGSGKSTFLRLLNGLVLPSDGSVRVRGRDTRRDGRAVRRVVGFVFQDPDLQIVMPTVAEDVAFGLRHHGVPRADRPARVASVLDRFGLTALRERPAHLLSGGEKQLLAIASVTAVEPGIVVFDEPTTALDLRNQRRVWRVIDELPQQVVLATHDLDALDRFDRVLLFDDGALVADGPPAEVRAAYLTLLDTPDPPP